MKVQVFIGDDELDLFNDENIVITSRVKDVSDISKTSTDFSQSFNVPATSKNNRIFKFWFNEGVVNGFDARKRQSAHIDVGFGNFRKGVIQLNQAVKSNGNITQYNITFFGQGVSLADTFGEDMLTDLDLSTYNFEFSDSNVRSRTTTSSDENYLFPLISTNQSWSFNSLVTNDISDNPLNQFAGLNMRELRPMIKNSIILDAIESKYNINFVGSMLSSTFKNQYTWANRTNGLGYFITDWVDATWSNWTGSESVTSSQPRVDISVSFNPSSTNDWDGNYFEVEITDDLGNVYIGTNEEFPERALAYVSLRHNGVNQTRTYTVRARVKGVYNSTMLVNIRRYTSSTNFSLFTSSTQVLIDTENFYFADYQGIRGELPSMKISDWFSGQIRSRNVAITPTNNNSEYSLDLLDTWYNAGNTINLDRYIDSGNVTIKRVDLPNDIEFSYDSTDEIATNVGFRANANRNYGDLNADLGLEGGNLSVELPFDNMLLQRIQDSNNNEITRILVGNSINTDLEPIETGCIQLFYNGGVTLFEFTRRLGWRNQSGTLQTLNRYNLCSQERINTTTFAITDSLNWGSEISSFNLTETNASLFSSYWQNYVNRLTDINSRLKIFKGYLPTFLINQINLNDEIHIGINRYIINKMVANLVTGETTLELINV